MASSKTPRGQTQEQKSNADMLASKQDPRQSLTYQRYGMMGLTMKQEAEMESMQKLAVKGDQQAIAKMNELNNLETAKMLKGIKDTTGSFPKPAEIPKELRYMYKHTMPDQVENIVNKVNAGQPINTSEETQLNSIHARGIVDKCGDGCTCGVDGHCSGRCPAVGFECSFSKDKVSFVEPKASKSPIDSIIDGIGQGFMRLIHGQNIITGQPVLGVGMPFTLNPQTIMVPA